LISQLLQGDKTTMDLNQKKALATILLVDDDDTFRDAAESLLKNSNYDIISAGGLQEATELLAGRRIDLIITDLKMNDGTGLDLLAKAREKDREIGVIIQTAYGSVRNAVDAMRQGAYDYITKPYKNEELLILVERALEHKNIREELTVLREEIAWRYGFDSLVGISSQMKQLKCLAARVATTDISILITGESGTGKELLAKAIHYHSNRRKKKFIPIDCTSIPANLMESEFFGHAKGSFTSAYNAHKGLFEEADGGTVFLDEIGDMPLPLQAKILRVLQESEIRPVGSSISKKIDIRILAATNRNLQELVMKGQFREDLFYRLNVLPILIPPLRERPDDVAVLIEHFIRNENNKEAKSSISMSSEAMEILIKYDWPGNVRELENTIKRAIALSHDGRIKGSDIIFISSNTRVAAKEAVDYTSDEPGTLEESLKQRIESTLYANNWNFSKTALKLGIGRTTLWRKIRKYNINRNESISVEQN
jgi:DNA-binding NtrC family response regulator